MVDGAEAGRQPGAEHGALSGAHDRCRLAAAAVGEGQAGPVEREPPAGAGAGGAEGDEAADLSGGGGVRDEHAVLDRLDLLEDEALDGPGVHRLAVGPRDQAFRLPGARLRVFGQRERARCALRWRGRARRRERGGGRRGGGGRGRVGGARDGEDRGGEVEVFAALAGPGRGCGARRSQATDERARAIGWRALGRSSQGARA